MSQPEATGSPNQPDQDAAPRARWWQISQPWVSLVLRLGIAAVALAAAIPKLGDLAQAKRAVYAYRIFPTAISDLLGVAVPVVELAIGVALVLGLFTRYAAALFGLMMLGFMVGISQAWARGLTIDCGCFGGGGELTEGQVTQYAIDLVRDAGLALASAVLMVWPASPASLDKVLRLDPVPKDAL